MKLSLLVMVGGMLASSIVSSCAQTKQKNVLNDPSVFPIAVWLQSPSNAAKYKAAGINLFVALWEGPTDAQLADLKKAGMPVICEQNKVGLAHMDDPTIVAWMHGDEPDNAQPMKDPATGKDTYGPCIPPAKIVADYERIKKADPSRPVMLNLGQGVANDQWNGRGNGAQLSDYETYVHGGDIVSFDVYPVAGLDRPDGENYLWYVAKGVDRLMKWTGGRSRVWNCIECTCIGSDKKATPLQVKSEVWMSLIHGSKGLIYFVHQFKPTFCEWALLNDQPMLEAVTAVNNEIQRLAPVLNSASIPDGVKVVSSKADVPVDAMMKKRDGVVYVFSAGMRNGATQATFTVDGVKGSADVEAIGENRTLQMKDGSFTDDFAPYAVHLYKMKAE